MRDNLFIQLKHENGANVIGQYNAQTRQWNIFDFFMKISTYRIIGLEQGNLIIQTREFESFIYRISFGYVVFLLFF
jgi:hypothetical protein